MMTDFPEIKAYFGSLDSMLRKFDRYARRDCFRGKTVTEFEAWRLDTRRLLHGLLGLDKMEVCRLDPVVEDVVTLPDGIRREHVRIQVEPDVWMPMFVLVPPGAGPSTRPFLCPPGHNGAGKYTVAGLREFRQVDGKIQQYHYDYGLQLAKLGYVAVCPDCRGFGERREMPPGASAVGMPPGAGASAAGMPTGTYASAGMNPQDDPMKGDCYRLAHMGEPLGIPVAGMLTWDLMRAVDYLTGRGEWDCNAVGCLGFSGGGMQTLWLSALDERICPAVISGYMYGYRDALLALNQNCSCNYVPHLWEHLDMGDIAGLIAPRPLLVQSCRDDRLNGPRGIANAVEQVDTIRSAYRLMGAGQLVIHEICEGPHRWHGERLEYHLEQLIERYNYFKTNQEIHHG